jgi:hypothetical protein
MDKKIVKIVKKQLKKRPAKNFLRCFLEFLHSLFL